MTSSAGICAGSILLSLKSPIPQNTSSSQGARLKIIPQSGHSITSWIPCPTKDWITTIMGLGSLRISLRSFIRLQNRVMSDDFYALPYPSVNRALIWTGQRPWTGQQEGHPVPIPIIILPGLIHADTSTMRLRQRQERRGSIILHSHFFPLDTISTYWRTWGYPHTRGMTLYMIIYGMV